MACKAMAKFRTRLDVMCGQTCAGAWHPFFWWFFLGPTAASSPAVGYPIAMPSAMADSRRRQVRWNATRLVLGSMHLQYYMLNEADAVIEAERESIFFWQLFGACRRRTPGARWNSEGRAGKVSGGTRL